MALLDDGKSVCPDGQAGMTVLPEFALSEAKARESNTAAERLNAIMQESAHQHLWSFADGHRATFRGRGLCAGYSDAPGPWPTSCASRARSTAPGSPSTHRNGAPTPRASACFAPPTMPS